MIRVGFVLAHLHSGWMGGMNYYSNMLHAIAGSSIIEPVLLVAPGAPNAMLSQFPSVEVIRTSLVDPASKIMKARKIAEGLYGRAFIFEHFLRHNNIQVLSHSGHLGRRSRYPSVGWIPDFQHRRLPEFFSAEERSSRDRGFGRLAEFCSRVIVSSEDARRDLSDFRPSLADKARVLHFVSGFANASTSLEDRQSLLARYDIQGPYFHLPNQFWAHKNHTVVIDALRVLKEGGEDVVVVTTGNTKDDRKPDYFPRLMEKVTSYGLERNFRVLGLVPYGDLAALMHHSAAIINPSLFEGWSTTVEESKSLGKTIVLSDIPVHREQAPDFGHFFDPKDPAELARILLEVRDGFSPSSEKQQMEQARNKLPERIRQFSADFETLILETSRLR